MDKIGAGELDRRITIETPTEVRKPSGHVDKTWSTLATVWAKKIEKGGGEPEEEEREKTLQKTDFIIRYRSDLTITTAQRINYDSKIYDIKRVSEIGRREFFEIQTEYRG